MTEKQKQFQEKIDALTKKTNDFMNDYEKLSKINKF
jgi:hypothetical protein